MFMPHMMRSQGLYKPSNQARKTGSCDQYVSSGVVH
jgi:hypothetical protein